MLSTYIPESLVKELEAAFPNELPTQREYKEGITEIGIAFRAGFCDCIRYLRHTMEAQQQAETTTDEIKII